MKLKDFSLFMMFWLFAVPAFAQFQLSGTITDRDTGEPIEGVQIYDNEFGKSFLTNKNGYFEINGLPDRACSEKEPVAGSQKTMRPRR